MDPNFLKDLDRHILLEVDRSVSRRRETCFLPRPRAKLVKYTEIHSLLRLHPEISNSSKSSTNLKYILEHLFRPAVEYSGLLDETRGHALRVSNELRKEFVQRSVQAHLHRFNKAAKEGRRPSLLGAPGVEEEIVNQREKGYDKSQSHARAIANNKKGLNKDMDQIETKEVKATIVKKSNVKQQLKYLKDRFAETEYIWGKEVEVAWRQVERKFEAAAERAWKKLKVSVIVNQLGREETDRTMNEAKAAVDGQIGAYLQKEILGKDALANQMNVKNGGGFNHSDVALGLHSGSDKSLLSTAAGSSNSTGALDFNDMVDGEYLRESATGIFDTISPMVDTLFGFNKQPLQQGGFMGPNGQLVLDPDAAAAARGGNTNVVQSANGGVANGGMNQQNNFNHFTQMPGSRNFNTAQPGVALQIQSGQVMKGVLAAPLVPIGMNSDITQKNDFNSTFKKMSAKTGFRESKLSGLEKLSLVHIHGAADNGGDDGKSAHLKALKDRAQDHQTQLLDSLNPEENTTVRLQSLLSCIESLWMAHVSEARNSVIRLWEEETDLIFRQIKQLFQSEIRARLLEGVPTWIRYVYERRFRPALLNAVKNSRMTENLDFNLHHGIISAIGKHESHLWEETIQQIRDVDRRLRSGEDLDYYQMISDKVVKNVQSAIPDTSGLTGGFFTKFLNELPQQIDKLGNNLARFDLTGANQDWKLYTPDELSLIAKVDKFKAQKDPLTDQERKHYEDLLETQKKLRTGDLNKSIEGRVRLFSAQMWKMAEMKVRALLDQKMEQEVLPAIFPSREEVKAAVANTAEKDANGKDKPARSVTELEIRQIALRVIAEEIFTKEGRKRAYEGAKELDRVRRDLELAELMKKNQDRVPDTPFVVGMKVKAKQRMKWHATGMQFPDPEKEKGCAFKIQPGVVGTVIDVRKNLFNYHKGSKKKNGAQLKKRNTMEQLGRGDLDVSRESLDKMAKEEEALRDSKGGAKKLSGAEKAAKLEKEAKEKEKELQKKEGEKKDDKKEGDKKAENTKQVAIGAKSRISVQDRQQIHDEENWSSDTEDEDPVIGDEDDENARRRRRIRCHDPARWWYLKVVWESCEGKGSTDLVDHAIRTGLDHEGKRARLNIRGTLPANVWPDQIEVVDSTSGIDFDEEEGYTSFGMGGNRRHSVASKRRMSNMSLLELSQADLMDIQNDERCAAQDALRRLENDTSKLDLAKLGYIAPEDLKDEDREVVEVDSHNLECLMTLCISDIKEQFDQIMSHQDFILRDLNECITRTHKLFFGVCAHDVMLEGKAGVSEEDLKLIGGAVIVKDGKDATKKDSDKDGHKRFGEMMKLSIQAAIDDVPLYNHKLHAMLTDEIPDVQNDLDTIKRLSKRLKWTQDLAIARLDYNHAIDPKKPAESEIRLGPGLEWAALFGVVRKATDTKKLDLAIEDAVGAAVGKTRTSKGAKTRESDLEDMAVDPDVLDLDLILIDSPGLRHTEARMLLRETKRALDIEHGKICCEELDARRIRIQFEKALEANRFLRDECKKFLGRIGEFELADKKKKGGKTEDKEKNNLNQPECPVTRKSGRSRGFFGGLFGGRGSSKGGSGKTSVGGGKESVTDAKGKKEDKQVRID